MPVSSLKLSCGKAADLKACRTLMRTGSRSFYVAAHLLPQQVREPATALYAFCRLADDAIDAWAIDEGTAKRHALDRLRHRLDLAYAGRPDDTPVDRAFATVVAEHDMPRMLPLALLEGFEWDAAGRRYRTLDDLLDYAARVAGSVGAMMAVLMGARTPDALARACDLGCAMQLTNIARDIGEDARAGRLYLPLSWFEEAGLDVQHFLANPQHGPILGGLVARLLDQADLLYARGATGLAALPPGCRPGIRAAGLIYAEIGRVLVGRNHDSVTGRARVGAARKAALLARSVPAALTASRQPAAPALPACQFLVDAAARETAAQPGLTPVQAVSTRFHWVLDLFERLQDEQWETS